MGNIEIVYRQVATLENQGFVVGAVHFRGKPENEYAPLEWCNDEDVMDVDKFGAITIEQYEKNGYNFPDPNSDMVQWFSLEDVDKAEKEGIDKYSAEYPEEGEPNGGECGDPTASNGNVAMVNSHMVHLFNLVTMANVIPKDTEVYNEDIGEHVKLVPLLEAANEDVQWLLDYIGAHNNCCCASQCGDGDACAEHDEPTVGDEPVSFLTEFILRKTAMMAQVNELADKAEKVEEDFADWITSVVDDITEDDLEALFNSKSGVIEERDRVTVHALYMAHHANEGEMLRDVLGVFLDHALHTGKYRRKDG